jgi:hypothetical protein
MLANDKPEPKSGHFASGASRLKGGREGSEVTDRKISPEFGVKIEEGILHHHVCD